MTRAIRRRILGSSPLTAPSAVHLTVHIYPITAKMGSLWDCSLPLSPHQRFVWVEYSTTLTACQPKRENFFINCLSNLRRGKKERKPHRPKQHLGRLSKGIIRKSRNVGYWSWVIVRCAETGRAPPASGVIVRAAAFSAGLRTVRTEFLIRLKASPSEQNDIAGDAAIISLKKRFIEQPFIRMILTALLGLT